MPTRKPILGAVGRAFDDDPAEGAGPRLPAPRTEPSRPRRSPAGLDGLSSADPVVRREALALVVRRPIGPRESAALGRVLLRDPEPSHRLLAAEALERTGAIIPAGIVDRALQDPDDRVRRAAVAIALRKGSEALPLLIPRATERAWPGSHLAVLGALPGLVRERVPLPRELLDRLLLAIGALDPPPLPEERPALAELVRVVGVDTLVTRFAGSERVRAGAARLLIAEGTAVALEAVAAMPDRGVPQLRALRGLATARLRTVELAAAARMPSRPLEPEPAETAPLADIDQVLTAMARALGDPDTSVRAEARSALMSLAPQFVEEWVRRALDPDPSSTSTDVDPVLACAVAEQVPFPAQARSLLHAALAVAAEDRGPYLRALAALKDAPPDLADAVLAVPPSERPDAVRLVWQVGGHPILPSLRELLEDSAAAVRIAVLEALEEAADAGAAELAHDLVRSDPSPDVRRRALALLAGAGEGERVDALRDALSDGDPGVRAAAVDLLGAAPSAPLVPLLLAALRDQDELVWRTAAVRAGEAADSELGSVWDAVRDLSGERREAVLDALVAGGTNRLSRLAAENLRSPDAEERILALTVAARARTNEAPAAVLAALSDPEPAVRRAAAAEIAALGDPTAIPALARALIDPKADVRVEAVRALGALEGDAVPQFLIEALKDPEVRVRELAAEALARRRSAAVATRLSAALASPDLRRPAGAVLERIGEAAIEPLVEVVMGEDADAAGAAGALLDRLAGVARFTDALSSTVPDERLTAVRVLGTIGGTDATDGLLSALADPDVRVRAVAAGLLGELGERRAVTALRRVFVSDPVLDVASAAEASLTRLGAPPSRERAGDERDRPGAWFDLSERPGPRVDLEGTDEQASEHGVRGEGESSGPDTAG